MEGGFIRLAGRSSHYVMVWEWLSVTFAVFCWLGASQQVMPALKGRGLHRGIKRRRWQHWGQFGVCLPCQVSHSHTGAFAFQPSCRRFCWSEWWYKREELGPYFFFIVRLIGVPVSSFFPSFGISLGYLVGSGRGSLRLMEGKQRICSWWRKSLIPESLGSHHLCFVWH